MTKRLAGRLASHRCERAAAANDTQDVGAAGDASEEATQSTGRGCHAAAQQAAVPDGQQ